jgi:hypothetical protein
MKVDPLLSLKIVNRRSNFCRPNNIYPVGARNFSSYARRSARVFGSKKIVRQVPRLERMIDKELRDLDA